MSRAKDALRNSQKDASLLPGDRPALALASKLPGDKKRTATQRRPFHVFGSMREAFAVAA